MSFLRLRGRGRLAIASLALVALLASAGAVWAGTAKTIIGTAGNDNLVGTAGPDKLVGKGGNDKLNGRGGNDVLLGGLGNDILIGGPGADTLNCGPGKDIAVADKLDKVSASCEMVKGLPKPAVSISSTSGAEGNSGTTTLSFTVSLSAASAQPVSVSYATHDATATAPSDYTAANGTLTLQPGQKSTAIQVSVVGDTNIEQDETFTVTLSNPVNATIANGTATGTITNDDTAVPVTAGSYQGQTQNGNYLFFTVTPSRTVTSFRLNSLPLGCDPPATLYGAPNFGDSTFTIGDDGSFLAQGSWDGTDVEGDLTFTHWDAKIAGQFTTPTTVTGTIVFNLELNYQGTHYRCGSGNITWSATRQG